jgi:hypothetical protein
VNAGLLVLRFILEPLHLGTTVSLRPALPDNLRITILEVLPAMAQVMCRFVRNQQLSAADAEHLRCLLPDWAVSAAQRGALPAISAAPAPVRVVFRPAADLRDAPSRDIVVQTSRVVPLRVLVAVHLKQHRDMAPLVRRVEPLQLEDALQLTCRNQLVSASASAATLRLRVWKSPDDLVVVYSVSEAPAGSTGG